MVDELDIHLHPLWQRDIAQRLQEQFPHLQFIVASHSPLIAAGAGKDARTLKFSLEGGRASIVEVRNIASMRVDHLLQSEAFGLVSPFSPQTQEDIDRYDSFLKRKGQLNQIELQEFNQLKLFVEEARPIGGPPVPGSLESRIDAYLSDKLQ